MGFARFLGFGSKFSRAFSRRKDRKKAAARRDRRLLIEQFEVRQLLAASPALQIVSISPYETSILGTTPPSNALIYGPGISNTVRVVAPTELVLDFNQGQNIDPATLGGIQVFRSGGDNQFQTSFTAPNAYTSNPLNTAIDVPVPIGSATINQTLNTTNNQLSSNEVVIRFAQDLPADLYQIVIIGKRGSALDGRATAKQTPLGSVLAPATPGSGDQPFNGGQDQVIYFTLETGAHVTSVVPQPISRTGTAANSPLAQARNEIDVYFDQQLNAASAQDPSLYQLIVTNNTANTTDDTVVATSHYTVQYSWNAATGISVSRLIFDADLSTYDTALATRGAASAYRLRVGTQYYPFSTDAKTAIRSADETFAGADLNDLGKVQNAATPLGGETWVINGSIVPQTYALEWPGGLDTPGVRSLPNQPQVNGENRVGSPDLGPTGTIPVMYYNFADRYNTNDLTEHNEITDAQKQLARDIFQIYAYYLGVKFVETYSPTTVDGQITIATGDLAALGETSGPGGIIGMGGGGEAVMDGAEDWGNNAYGGSWFSVAMHEIGHVLGYGHDDDTAELSVMNISSDPTANLTPAENIIPSPQNIATGLNMYRSDSSDIDLYRFELPTNGTLSLETIAERMQNSSTLNSTLILYNAQHQVIARNDDYFGADSYINIANLTAGTYYVGISASGNDSYNPNVPLSGMNGKSQGDYQLRVSFAPAPAAPAAVLTDGNIALDNSASISVTFTAGTAPLKSGTDSGHPVIDTSALTSVAGLDGQTFKITKGTNTYTFEFVDASNPTRQAAQGNLALSFNSQTDILSTVLQDIASGINNAVSNLVDTTATPLDGENDGIPGGQFNYWFNVQDTAHTLYVDKVASTSGAVGSLAHPFTTIQAALAAAPGPAALQTDGNITIDNSTIAFTFGGGTTPFTSGTDSGHPAILGITAANIPSMAALNHAVFTMTRTGTGTVTSFEFVDVTVANNAAASGRQPVYFHSKADTPVTLQSIITKAINGAVQPGEIVRVVGNNFANDNGGNTIIAVAANLNTSTPLIQNGQTFQISDGLQTLTFEYTRTGTVTAGRVPVLIKSTDTAAQVAADIAAAINGVSVNTTKRANGLHAAATVAQDPVSLKWQVVITGPSVSVNLGALVQNNPLPGSLQDNVAYQIGTDPLGNVLADGANASVPKGVTMMIDAGAVFKMMKANIDAGSSAVNIDRSQSAIQVLGTPNEPVYFTSWNDERVGSAYYKNSQGPNAGDWGGIVYRNDFDYQEQVADPTRKVMEQQGIFLDYVNQANIAYGGGMVTVNGIRDYYDPIYLAEARPTITYNTIVHSQHAGVSADPNSFQETLFHDRFGEAKFTADYQRSGPAIFGNTFTTDVYNGVFIRVTTAAGSSQEKLTTDARLTATDAVYVLAETLTIAGNAGGQVANIYSAGLPVALGNTATTNLTSASNNRLSVPMNPATNANAAPNQTGTASSPATLITDLESFILSDTYTSVRFEFDYSASHGASDGSVEIAIDPAFSAAQIAAAITAAINGSGLRITATTTILAGGAGAAYVNLSGSIVVVKGLTEVEARLNGRLDIDPGVIVKASAARIETEVGGQFLAEGTIDRPIVFTSLLDQAYGAGGSFDTANQNTTVNPHLAAAGDWSGLYFAPTSSGSLDYVRLSYGGGSSAIEGRFATFAPVEIRQAQVRITDSVFSNNTAATVARGDDRNGRGDLPDNTVIQIRGAQPILVNDVIMNNPTAEAISIDPNSLNSFQLQDWGRSTGPASVFTQYADNVGPMVRQIKMSNNAINGMMVRAGTMVTEGVWDDTDIVHVVEGPIVMPNVTIYGGLRLQSNAQESLVVKLLGANAEFLATGTPVDIQGRIGGALQVIGTPSHPVVLTSLHDNSVGAGFDPWGNPLYDTENAIYKNIHDGTNITAPAAGDWNSLILNTYSNEYNAAEINEYEPAYGTTTDLNGSVHGAQYLGQLAQSTSAGDDTLRLGFEVHGSISYNNTSDKDVYSFDGTAGTQVWLNIDRTTYSLDSQIDLLDANGNVLATAYASIDPATGNQIAPQFVATGQYAATMDPHLATLNGVTLSTGDPWYVNNMYSTNPNDAGMRVVLPGPTGQTRTYYVRVSSHSGKASGNYELQIRLQSTRITPGNVVRYSTINYATNGVQVIGKPDHSPLEVQAYDYISGTPGSAANQASTAAVTQPAGNLLASDNNVLNIAGFLSAYNDVDWFSFNMDYNFQTGGSTIEIPKTSVFPVVFDIGYASGLSRPDAVIWVFDSTGKLILHGNGSQIADGQVEPLQGANSGNLTHTSYGAGDGYIGPVYLPTNSGTYYVAITTIGASSAQLQNNPLLRFQPVDSTNLIAQDNVMGQNAQAMRSAPPFVLFPGQTPAQVTAAAAVPFNLANVPLYVLTSQDLYTANAYTGAVETQVDSAGLPYTTGGPRVAYGDLAMRNDGRLYGVTERPQAGTGAGIDQNQWSGTFVQFDTGNASNAPISTQADGIKTYIPTGGTGLEVSGDDKNEDGGVHINAVTYGPGTANRKLYAVGNAAQNPAGIPSAGAATYGLTNLLYLMDENGNAVDLPGIVNDRSPRLPTQIIPLAQLLTGTTILAAPATLQNADILDGTQITITDTSTSAKTITFEMDSGPDIDLGKYGAQGVRSGQQFTLTEQETPTTDNPTGLVSKTFEFVSGPVLIFHNNVPGASGAVGSLDGATFTITDDKGITKGFEFIEIVPAPGTQTAVSQGFTEVNIPQNATAQQVANAAVTAINANGGDCKAALGEYGSDTQAEPTAGSTWARVSLIMDSLNNTPTSGNTKAGGNVNLTQVEGSYNQLNPNATPIFFKETYSDPTFLALETATYAPGNATTDQEAFPWAATFGAQIQTIVQTALPQIKVGYSAAGDTDMRINFYGAMNTSPGSANFGQASALVHDINTANADFNIRSVNVGAKYNNVKVSVVAGTNFGVAFVAGAGNTGGTLTITVTATTTALQVVTKINNDAAANQTTMPFTASLDGSLEASGTNNGTGLVRVNPSAATTAGGFDNGIMTWTDTNVIPGTTTPVTPQVENQYSPWGTVWTWRKGVDHLGDAGGLYGPLSGTGLQAKFTTNTLIAFSVGDDALTVSQEIASAINNVNVAGLFGASATQQGAEVALANVSAATAENPITVAGNGPGGNITGLAYMSIEKNDYYFAVSDKGGVYLISNINSPEFMTLPNLADPNALEHSPKDLQLTGGGAAAVYITTIRTAAGKGVQFQGLTTGPADVENGAYANTLFAIASDGTLYALLPQNLDQVATIAQAPIFASGATSMQVLNQSAALANVTGLAFTTLDYNLWHVTGSRGSGTAAADLGHGVNPANDQSQVVTTPNGLAVAGGTSFYFGLENPNTSLTAQPGARNYATNAGVYNTYDLPGGAAGSLQTQSFDLSHYSAGDQPMLYFNYYLANGGPSNTLDTARVFASADGANWTQLVGTDIGGLTANDPNWLQCRTSLAAFAGEANVRVRFDFSTAGDMGVGNSSYTGSYMTALSGGQLNDGDTFTLANVKGVAHTFELDMGVAIAVPNAAGDVLKNGETFTIQKGAGAAQTALATFEFTTAAVAAGDKLADGNWAIPYFVGETSTEVAQTIARAVNRAALINSRGTAILADQRGNRVMLNAAEGVTRSANTTISIQGLQALAATGAPSPGPIANGQNFTLTVGARNATFQFTPNGTAQQGRVPITFATTDTAEQIAAEMAAAINKANLGVSAVANGTVVALFGPTATFNAGTTLITLLSNGTGSKADPANILVPIKSTDSASQVATAIANALIGGYGPQLQLLQTVKNQGVADHSTFTITDPNGKLTTFEFTTGTAAAGNVLIALLTDDTATDIAKKIAAAINAAGLTFTAKAVFTQAGAATASVIVTATKAGMVFNAGSSPLTAVSAKHTGSLVNLTGYNIASSGIFPSSATLPGDDPSHNRFKNKERGQDNAHEGWYVDDVEIGFAGRGEMVTRPANGAGNTSRDFTFTNPGGITSGYYTLQIRRASDYGVYDPAIVPPLTIERTFEIHDRLANAISLTTPAANNISNGETFTVSDGVHLTTFQYLAQGVNSTVTNPNYQPIYFSGAQTSTQIATATAAAINLANTRGLTTVEATAGGVENTAVLGNPIVDIRAVQLKAVPGSAIQDQCTFTLATSLGKVTTFQLTSTGTTPLGTPIDYLVTDTADQVAVKIAAAITNAGMGLTATFNGDLVAVNGSGVTFQEQSSPLINVNPQNTVSAAGVYLFQAAYVTSSWTPPTVTTGMSLAENVVDVNYTDQGDVWNVSDQGQTLIESNTILNAANYGVSVTSNDPAAHPYSVNVMRAVNSNRLVPGITIENNVMAYGGAGGVLFSGNASANGAAPFGRIVNNTIYGGTNTSPTSAQRVGITVKNNASPTILNNVLSTLETGIQVVTGANDVSGSTIVGYSVYQNNTLNNNLAANADTGAIYAANDQQLFVDPANGNFYPSQYSPVIDSSVNQLDDRPDMVTVRQPLAIPSSPILAPNLDLYGQLRIANPQVSPFPGLGSNVYKDRGAIDRVDFIGPTTALLTPQDNDASGVDIDPRVTWVTTTQQQTQFAVQLNDDSAGVDSNTVTAANVVLKQNSDNNPANSKTLVQGTDYFFQYDATNHIIRLIPAAGVWAEGYTYNILLTTSIQDLAGNPLQPNRLDNTNQFTIVLAGPNGSNSVPAAGIDFSHAPGEPVAWQVVPTTPNLYLGKIPPIIPQTAYVATQTRADNESIDTTKFTLAQGVTTTIPVTVHNAGTTTAYLSMWLDYYGVPSTAIVANAAEVGNVATITTTAAHGFSVGQQVTIAGVAASGYNGTFTIDSIPTATTFTYTNPTTGLAASNGGTASHQGSFADLGDQVVTDIPVAPAATIANATQTGNVVTITTTAAHGFSVGEQLAISGVGVTGYNGTATITSVTATSFTYVLSGVTGLAASTGGTATLTVVPVTFTVPGSLNPATPTATIATWLRVRLSTQQGLTSDGGMPVDATVGDATALPDGEVEDFAISILPPVTVTGTIWNDLNADGTHQAAEPGLGGWTVYADVGNLGFYVATDPSTTTAADGTYTLNGVPPGSVKIGEIAPSGWVETSPSPLPPTNGFATINGGSGQTVSNINFLNYQTIIIKGTVWNDLNPIGTHESYEPGLGGWNVYVDLNGNKALDTGEPSAVTADDGTYAISNAPANITNTVREVMLTGWVVTAPASGAISVTGAAGQTITGKDFLNNYTVPPAISTITLSDPTPTNLTTVHYVVTFTVPVNGVDAAAFNLAAVNLTGDAISSVTPVGTPVSFGGKSYYLTWTVTVATGALTNAANTGTLGLNGVVDAAVVGTNGKTITSTFTGPTYMIDRIAPLVSSIAMTDATPTNALANAPVNTVDYAVTFSKPVTGLDANDLVLAAPALTGEAITSVVGVGTSVVFGGQNYYTAYTVTVNVGAGSGTLGLNLAMSAAPADLIHDQAGNTLPSSMANSGSSASNPFVGPVYTIDKISPTTAIALATGQANPAATGPIKFTVIFSEPVFGFTTAGVDLSSSTAPGVKVQSVTGSGTTWTVSVSGMTGNGTVVTRVRAGAATDAAGNPNLASAAAATVSYVSTPLVTIATAATQATPVNRGPLVFTVTFNQPVVDFTAAKISYAGSTAPGTLKATVSGSGTTYTVSVTGMTATGLVKVSVPAGVVHNASGAANAASTGPKNSVFYCIDPATEALSNPATGSTILDSTINARGYIDVIYSAQTGVGVNTSTITDAGQEFSLSGAGATGVVINGIATPMGGDVFRYSYSGKFNPGLVTVNFAAGTFLDNAGNANKAASYSFNVARGVTISNVSIVKPTSGTAKAVFTVSLSSPATTTVTVRYATANGLNTVAGRDYIALSGILTFKPGLATTQTISVPIIGNATPVTTTETFLVNLSAPVGATLVAGQSTGTGTILSSTSAKRSSLLAASPLGPQPLSSALLASIARAAQGTSSTTQQTSAADAVLATWYK